MEFDPFGRRRATAPLGQYRLYYLDSVERLISGSFEFEATGDDDAISIADGMRKGRPAELWSGSEKLKSWS